jgi:hypothetical protein
VQTWAFFVFGSLSFGLTDTFCKKAQVFLCGFVRKQLVDNQALMLVIVVSLLLGAQFSLLFRLFC